ncbi:MAG: glutamine-dependent NAD(+) synthetase [Pleopsidium flavum]|nr:MAG: glutamine-dependent NAD(+) synthetase [Pleopsidium flavum]
MIYANRPVEHLEEVFALLIEASAPTVGPSKEIEVHHHLSEQEVALGSACWLWNYLRRCGGAADFFLPLSGGIDSYATTTVGFPMCWLLIDAVEKEDAQVIKDVTRICGESGSSKWLPTKPPRSLQSYVGEDEAVLPGLPDRHKMTVLSPAYHAEQDPLDNNRGDLRPFLYLKFSWMYKKIEGDCGCVGGQGREGGRESWLIAYYAVPTHKKCR